MSEYTVVPKNIAVDGITLETVSGVTKVKDGGIGHAKLDDDAVDSHNIIDESVLRQKLSGQIKADNARIKISLCKLTASLEAGSSGDVDATDVFVDANGQNNSVTIDGTAYNFVKTTMLFSTDKYIWEVATPRSAGADFTTTQHDTYPTTKRTNTINNKLVTQCYGTFQNVTNGTAYFHVVYTYDDDTTADVGYTHTTPYGSYTAYTFANPNLTKPVKKIEWNFGSVGDGYKTNGTTITFRTGSTQELEVDLTVFPNIVLPTAFYLYSTGAMTGMKFKLGNATELTGELDFKTLYLGSQGLTTKPTKLIIITPSGSGVNLYDLSLLIDG